MDKFTYSSSTNYIPDVPDSPPAFDRALPKFNIWIHDCDCHSFNDVFQALQHIVGLPHELATQKTNGAHAFGKALVATVHQELAESYMMRMQMIPGSTGQGLLVTMERV